MPKQAVAGVIAIVLSAPLSVGAADLVWPQFRGPASNPVAENPRLPDRWSKTENVEWSTAIAGRGWSSPIVAEGKIFLTAVETEGKSKPPQTGTEYSNEYVAELMKQGLSQQEVFKRVTERDIEMPEEVTLHYYLYCLNERTGAVVWKKEFNSGRPPGGRHRKNSFASETPVTDGKMVYVYVTNLGIFAFDYSGKQVWSEKLEAYPIYLDFGTGSSPILHGNMLLILNDNQQRQFLAAYDKSTGKKLWVAERDMGPKGEMAQRSGWTTPYIWKNDIRTEIVTVGPQFAISYDLAGKELWRLAGMATTPIPSPFASGGLLYVNAGRGKALYAIRPGASGEIVPGTPEAPNKWIAWSDPRGGTYLPTGIAYASGIYSLTETGILTRFDAQTGKVIYKSRLAVDAGYFTTSPWAYNGKIFCLSEEGKTFVVKGGDTFEVLSTNPLEEMAQSTPAIAGDRLLLRTESRLYSIRAGKSR